MKTETRKKSPEIQEWETLAPEAVFKMLETDSSGLSSAEAELRLEKYGPNQLKTAKGKHPLRRFIEQFNNILIYVLLIAAVITALLDHWVDTWVILAVVIINAVIGFIQEGKAEKALDSIKNLLVSEIMIERDNKKTSIAIEKVVPGDVVVLQSGDKVPADLRLFKTRELRVDEAILTGESMPVDKNTEPVKKGTPLAEHSGMAFSGTLVTSGQGRGVVVSTGDKTELGKINMMLGNVKSLTTPLVNKLNQFSKLLTFVIIAVAALAFLLGVFLRDYTLEEMFLASVGLFVAAIPEGLPAIVTITLAIGVKYMAGRNAIIRRLPAVETLGSVTVICSDKTGTLTRNEMTVKSVVTAENFFEVSGAGYEPHGSFNSAGEEISSSDYPNLAELLRAGLLCNDSALNKKEDKWIVNGDPTEGALLTLAMKDGLELKRTNEEWPRDDTIPFDSKNKFMATLHHTHEGEAFIYLKGAPEVIFENCRSQIKTDGTAEKIDTAKWKEIIEKIAGKGQRTLALARKKLNGKKSGLDYDDITDDFLLLGVVGIIDPPRHETVTAIKECKSAGIKVKMITGDHEVTARAIGKDIGIGDGSKSLSGKEIENMTADALRKAVAETDIFARVNPEHKLRIVEALQENNEVVAMTGDGVNDAPALKRANIGIAMGIKGTEVAKESSEMVLTDDNFASIVSAVKQGRTVYDNIRKCVLFILPTNGGESLTILASVALGMMLPITPVQILWINMITASTLSLALAFEPSEKNIMKRHPRHPDEPLLTTALIMRILFVSLILVTGTFGLFYWERQTGASIETARTIAVNTLVMFEAFYLVNTRHMLSSVLSFNDIFGNRYVIFSIIAVILFQLLFTYAPFMHSLFGSVPIGFSDWVLIVITTSSVFLLVELEKFFRRKALKRKNLKVKS